MELTLDELIDALVHMRDLHGEVPVGIRVASSDPRHASASIITGLTADFDKSGRLIVIEHD